MSPKTPAPTPRLHNHLKLPLQDLNARTRARVDDALYALQEELGLLLTTVRTLHKAGVSVHADEGAEPEYRLEPEPTGSRVRLRVFPTINGEIPVDICLRVEARNGRQTDYVVNIRVGPHSVWEV